MKEIKLQRDHRVNDPDIHGLTIDVNTHRHFDEVPKLQVKLVSGPCLPTLSRRGYPARKPTAQLLASGIICARETRGGKELKPSPSGKDRFRLGDAANEISQFHGAYEYTAGP